MTYAELKGKCRTGDKVVVLWNTPPAERKEVLKYLSSVQLEQQCLTVDMLDDEHEAVIFKELGIGIDAGEIGVLHRLGGEPQFCPPDCPWLWPNEQQQELIVTRSKGQIRPRHQCRRHHEYLCHGPHHPRLIKCEACRYV